MDSIAFLERKAEKEPRPVYVLPGDERFLKRRVLALLRTLVLGPEDDAFGLSTHAGDKANYSTVSTELVSAAFFSPRRLVVVDDADPFVTRERAKLEKYFASPSTTGVLVLDVQSWPGNTRLAKLTPDEATIVCKAPAAARLPEWCVQWCAACYGKQLVAAAARLLVDLVGGEMGLLDQEMAKLAAYAGDAKRIDAADVDALVGASRAENTWKIFDLIGDGKTGEALTLLDRLFEQGEDPFRLLGAVQYAAAAAGPGRAARHSGRAAAGSVGRGRRVAVRTGGGGKADAPPRPPPPRSAVRLAVADRPRPQGTQPAAAAHPVRAAGGGAGPHAGRAAGRRQTVRDPR